MVVMLSGILTSFNDEHPLNVYSFIVLIPCPIEIFSSDEHRENEFLPIVKTLFGMLTLSNDEQPENA